MRDNAVTAVLGGVLMIALMMMMVPSALMLRAALVDEMDAQREAASRAAWCARNPTHGPPTCPEAGPMPGYDCEPVDEAAWVCTKSPTPPVELKRANRSVVPG